MRQEKKKNSPPPGKYNLPSYSIQNIAKSTEEQRLTLADAKWKAMQVPSFKYELNKGY